MGHQDWSLDKGHWFLIHPPSGLGPYTSAIEVFLLTIRDVAKAPYPSVIDEEALYIRPVAKAPYTTAISQSPPQGPQASDRPGMMDSSFN